MHNITSTKSLGHTCCHFCARCQSPVQFSRMTMPDLIERALLMTSCNTNNVNRMEWPAKSPDLSCIEHVWDILGTTISVHLEHNSTLQDLRWFLREEWAQIPQCTIWKLVYSSKNRVCECRHNNGGYIHY